MELYPEVNRCLSGYPQNVILSAAKDLPFWQFGLKKRHFTHEILRYAQDDGQFQDHSQFQDKI
jgi:hypothetical protein